MYRASLALASVARSQDSNTVLSREKNANQQDELNYMFSGTLISSVYFWRETNPPELWVFEFKFKMVQSLCPHLARMLFTCSDF